MFKKNSHGLFCYCPACRVKRRLSLLHNIIISILCIISLYQTIITIFDFTRFHLFILLIEVVLLIFFTTRTLF